MLSGNKFCVDMTSNMYPGAIRANRKVVQRGVLEATPHSLIFTDDISQTKQLWPLKSLRNIEASNDKVFVIETAVTSSDIRVLSFSTPEAKQLQNLVLHHFHVMIHSEQPHQLSGMHSAVSSFPVSPTIPISVDDTGPTHWKLNTRLSMDSSSSSSTISPTHSRGSSIPRDIFEVDRILEDSSKKEHGTLEAIDNEIVFVECGGGGGKRIAWPFTCLRRFGYEGDIFTLEVGRKAPGGEGRHKFKTPRAAELNAAVKSTSVANIGRNTPPSPANVEKISKVHSPQFPQPPAQTPLLPPSQVALLPSTKHAPLPPLPLRPSQPLPPTPIPIHQHRHSQHSMAPKQFRDIEDESQRLSLSTPAFSLSDSLVRRAYSSHDLRHNIFEVRNISDDKKEVGQGTVEVTPTDLIYIDSSTHEKWKWPVRFLRKYGYEENIFSFEAGRRCPGGQGLYAFVSERANEIHETILESVHKQGGMPTKVPLTPQHVRTVPSSPSQFSLVDDQALKLASKNHYNDSTLNMMMKTRPLRQQSPASNLTTSHIVPTTTPNSVGSSGSPLNSSKVSSTPLNAAITPQSQLQNVKAHESPLYDKLNNYDRGSNSKASYNQPEVIGNGIINKKSSSPERRRSTASKKKRNSKSDQKRISESNPEVSDDAAISGDVAKDVMHKPRSNVLSRLIGKKSKKKAKRESADSNIIESQSFDQEGTERDMYVNIEMARSASCDDILNSCSAFDSQSTSTNEVPLPQLLHSQTPPTDRRPYENSCRFPEQRPISVPSSSAVYQNLNDMGVSLDRSHSDPIQAPITVLDTPPSHRNELTHLYSNVSVLAEEYNENQPQPPQNQTPQNKTPQSKTMYTELEIHTPPSVTPHGSPQPLPHPHSPFLNTNGRLPSTSNKSPLFTKPMPPSKSNQNGSNRQRSSYVLPDTVGPAEPDQSYHMRSQSECFQRNSSYEGNGGQTSQKNSDQVIYSPLDFVAINAVAQIKRDHADIRNFDEILKRHDIREMEMDMDRKKRRNVLT